MGEDTPIELTEDEAQLYDRQIRLWGIESQKSLRNANILIISMNGLGAEVAKNIILSGVKSVTFMDDVLASEDRAVASVGRAKDLNPLVTISALTNKPSTLNEDNIKNYDVIIAIEQNADTILQLDSLCRANKIKFFSADVFGMFGYFFADLQDHEYIMDVPTTLKKNKVHMNTVKEKRVEHFSSFEDIYEFDFLLEENFSFLKRMEPSFFVFRILMKFRNECKRYPNDSDEDFEKLSQLRDKELSGISYDKNKISDDLLKICVGCPTSPVCAILGAMVAQEVIKAVTHRDHPNKNMFFFNALTNVGHVQCLCE